MMHFVCTFAIMRTEGVKLIAIEEVQNYGKIYASKTFLKMAGGRMDTPHFIPLDPLLAINPRNHTYFSQNYAKHKIQINTKFQELFNIQHNPNKLSQHHRNILVVNANHRNISVTWHH